LEMSAAKTTRETMRQFMQNLIFTTCWVVRFSGRITVGDLLLRTFQIMEPNVR
jgi:hypothetical protein